jgi:hypothetical protein
MKRRGSGGRSVNCTGKEEEKSPNNYTDFRAHGLRNGRPTDEEPITIDYFANCPSNTLQN